MKFSKRRFFLNLISPAGKFGRVQFIMSELYRFMLLALCYLLYYFHLYVLCAALIPFSVWVGIVGTIKRFKDVGLNSSYILFSLTLISTGFGLAWQTQYWIYSLSGLGPYLLWISLTPGKRDMENI